MNALISNKETEADGNGVNIYGQIKDEMKTFRTNRLHPNVEKAPTI